MEPEEIPRSSSDDANQGERRDPDPASGDKARDRRAFLLRLATLSFLTAGVIKEIAPSAAAEKKHHSPPPPYPICGEPHDPGYAEDFDCGANSDPDSDCGLRSDNPLGGAHQDYDCTNQTVGPLLDDADNDCGRPGGAWTPYWADNDCPLTGTDQDCDLAGGAGFNWEDNDCSPPGTAGSDQGYCPTLDWFYDDDSGTPRPPLP